MKYLAALLFLALILVPTDAAAAPPFAPGEEPAPFIHISMSPATSSPGQQANIQGWGFAIASHQAVYVVGVNYFFTGAPAFGDYFWKIDEPYYIGTLQIGATKTCTETLTVPFNVFTQDTTLWLQVWEDTDPGTGTNWRGSNGTPWSIDV